jgi:hypothetical protein
MKKMKNLFLMSVVVLAGVFFITDCDGDSDVAPNAPAINVYYVANREVAIAWDVVDNADSYNLYWNNTGGVSTADNSITDLTPSYATTNFFDHSPLSLFKTYYYRVSSVNAAGESGLSNEVSVVPVAVPTELKKRISSDATDFDYFGFSASMSGDLVLVGAPGEDGAGSDYGAAYIYGQNEGGTDNWGEAAKLTASDAQNLDEFGRSVAISGDYAVVGAHFEDSTGSDRGAAYLYYRNQGGTDNWGEVVKLTASDAQDWDEFGTSVAISGDYAIVGAQYEDSGGLSSGAAYVYYRNQGGTDNWGEVLKLTASDAAAGDLFGFSVALSGDYAVVGAYSEDDGGADSGAAYVYYRNQGGTDNWGEVLKLAASDAAAGDLFGGSVAISGDYVVVSATREDDGGADSGAAYIYYRNQGGTDNWGEVVKLTASDAETLDEFGGSVAINGDYVVIGAFYEDGAGTNRGAAYIYDRNVGGQDNWGEVMKIVASDAEDGDNFGVSVAVSGDFVSILAPYEEAFETDRGALYIF